MGRLIVKTESDGETVIAVGENYHDLARQLGITPQAVSHGSTEARNYITS